MANKMSIMPILKMKITPEVFPRPGDFDHNCEITLRLLNVVALSSKTIEFPLYENLITGGDCGSLSDHPVFKKKRSLALNNLLRAAKKIPNAPKIVLKYYLEPDLLGCGDDPRLPFCGHPEDVFTNQTMGLVKRLSSIGCRHVVIGLSGGLDSALTLLVAYMAFKILNFDLSGIHVYTMPGFGTTERTRGNADLLCEGLGLKLETIDITAACRQHFKDIGHPEDLHDVVFENAQARERTQILMDKANQVGGIVLGTGDMSEIALGWCTYNGDHMSMFATNSGVPKTAVRDVCMWWASAVEHDFANNGNLTPEECNLFAQFMNSAKALRDIVATPVSPELLPAKDGEIAQKTEDKIGPYELHDFFLWHFIAEEEGRDEIFKSAKKVFNGQYGDEEIKKWLDVFFKRFFSQSFKRNCAPDGIKIFKVYLAPNAWHIPSDISPSAIL